VTTSRIPSERTSLTSPIVDYEPPPLGPPCPPPSPAALRRRTPRPLRTLSAVPTRETPPPREAGVFAEAALRRVLEVIDRRRPVAQLRPLLAPALFDTVVALTRAPGCSGGAATLRRVRLRTAVHDDCAAHDDLTPVAAEVFATYTRGQRVRAIAARIETQRDRWMVVALQIG
jgi:hypothetical protein